MASGVFERFMKNWKQFENVVDEHQQELEGVETEWKEIREEVSEAITSLPSFYEDLKRQIEVFEELKERERKEDSKSGHTKFQKTRHTNAQH